MSETYFDALGLPANATDVQIRDAYRKLATEFTSQPERLAKIEEAYQVLANPITRRNYLQWLAAGEGANFKPDATGHGQPAMAKTPPTNAPVRRHKTELIESEGAPGTPTRTASPESRTQSAQRQPMEFIDSGAADLPDDGAQSRPVSGRTPPSPSPSPSPSRHPTEIVAPSEPRRPTDEVTRLNVAGAEGSNPDVAAWVLVSYDENNERFGLREGTHWIGRPSAGDPPPAVSLPDPEHFVSRRHARIFIDGATWTITDTSENGTQLNGKRLPKGKPHRLKSGDTIVIEGRKLVIRRPVIDD